MPIDGIAKEVSLSSKTIKRRLEMMRESHVMEFSILPNLTSMQLTGYVEFAVLINVDVYHYQYLFYIPNSYQKEFIFAVFFLCEYIYSQFNTKNTGIL
jgi:hypothetical protein